MPAESRHDEGGGSSGGISVLSVSKRVSEMESQEHVNSSPPAHLDDDTDEGEDYEAAITATGYGSFQYWLILTAGFANASDAIEILCVSILLPAAQCDFQMTSEDKGWLSATAFIGMMVGGYVWGCLGDIYGRRNVLMVSLMVNALSGFGSSLVQSFPSFLAFRFVSGLGVGGSIPLVWAYISEFQPPCKRGAALSIIASFWMIGNVLVAVFGLVTIPYDIGFEAPGFVYNSWRVFLTICALPALITAIVMLWMPESPMFLLSKNRKDEALHVLRNVYSLNTRRQPCTYPIKLLSTSGLKVQKDTSQNWWGTFRSAAIQTWSQTKAMFSRSLIFVTIIMTVINFTIQFGFLATGDSYKTIAFSYRLGHSTTQDIVLEVCHTIMKNLMSDAIPSPSKKDWKRIANEFWTQWSFPNCIAALDVKHVVIEAPANSGSLYFNYKKRFSVVLLALVDAIYRFISIDIRSYGKNSDSEIFANSKFSKYLEDKQLNTRRFCT